jgi:hypothetical protein
VSHDIRIISGFSVTCVSDTEKPSPEPEVTAPSAEGGRLMNDNGSDIIISRKKIQKSGTIRISISFSTLDASELILFLNSREKRIIPETKINRISMRLIPVKAVIEKDGRKSLFIMSGKTSSSEKNIIVSRLILIKLFRIL